MKERVGIVAIGRNEGERLEACLASARRDLEAIVYVDSGSTDDSVSAARRFGAEVVELDTTIPFTAARARNAGFERLLSVWPDLEAVQFVDGDCELESGWLGTALAAFDAEGWSVVCGRRRERYPERTVLNRLCDMEWDTPVGRATACGGDALMRVATFRQVGGFSEDLIAGEEPELCVRILAEGGSIARLDAPMTIHDAQMSSFSQWWQRSKRAGHAIAEGAARHPGVHDGHAEHEIRSAWVWAGLLPVTSLALAPISAGVSLALLALLPLQILRIGLRRPRPRYGLRHNLLYAGNCVLSKFPHLAGMLRFHFGRWTGRRSRLIEYKGAS